MTEHEFAGLQTTVEMDHLTHMDFWSTRFELFEEVQASKGVYESMSNVEREVVVSKVRTALEAMHDEVNLWLPAACTMETGDRVTVSFSILKSDIKDGANERRRLTSFKLREASEDIKGLLAELEEEDEAIDSQSERR